MEKSAVVVATDYQIVIGQDKVEIKYGIQFKSNKTILTKWVMCILENNIFVEKQ